MTRSVLFHRDYRGFSGGHLKVWDYFCHVAASREFAPAVHFTARSVLDATNPWIRGDARIERQWRPQDADLLFLGGMDWSVVPKECATPVINLIQGLRHADAAEPLYHFLSRPALRICVSDEVHAAIAGTGRVRGEIVTIPNGVDVGHIGRPRGPVADVVVSALKAPELGASVAAALRECGASVDLVCEPLPRDRYLQRLAGGRITVLLPTASEGFFLPALEAMALGLVVVCPDCVGNRGFCREGATFRPAYDCHAIVDAAKRALSLDGVERDAMRRAALAIGAEYSLANERKAFHRLLDRPPGAR